MNFVVSLCIRENNHPPSVKSRLISLDFLSGQFDQHVPSSMPTRILDFLSNGSTSHPFPDLTVAGKMCVLINEGDCLVAD